MKLNCKYDYIIIGAGLFGAICARELTDKGYLCLVIDSREHIGGNCYTKNIDDINIHVYGPHIFHTSNIKIWDYINKFATFNDYRHKIKTNFNGKLYQFPINLSTVEDIFGGRIVSDKLIHSNVDNLEEYATSKFGVTLYEMFIKGYSSKQWNRHPSNLPISIIKRLPDIRSNYIDNYYDDKYQGIPIGGYTQIFQKLLDGIEVRLNVDYFHHRAYFNSVATTTIYTGMIDKFYDYKYGRLEYRSLKFETERLEMSQHQSTSIVNYTDIKIPYTRIIEHKHFEMLNLPHTIITREYPEDYVELKNSPYYPINDTINSEIYKKYHKLSILDPSVIFGGRLGTYQYYDMHQVVGASLNMTSKIPIKLCKN
jgi:UDP-galactopyranose mutase